MPKQHVLPAYQPDIAISNCHSEFGACDTTCLFLVRKQNAAKYTVVFLASHPYAIKISEFIALLMSRPGFASMSPPSSPHPRIGRLARLRGLSTTGTRWYWKGTRRSSCSAGGGGER